MTSALEAAAALRTSGQAEEARILLLQLLDGDHHNAELYYQLAWTHDVLGLEREAVSYYEQSLALGLPDEEQRAGAMLGLGSTYRTLGEYPASQAMLEQGIREFPLRAEFKAFLAMTLHNLGAHAEAMELLLQLLADTSADPGIQSYSKAISFYADKLEERWD
ncbi:tetratricopeptide repeat protein [Paenibacillus sp. MMS20-IR301]|uniref:tetratricopeptide repeat protein n=1 Tax=Paenibacillus sp. MMS20-IR301 TaxID=2895946 RepID=UPI0028EAFDA6|nr:tetratricopeptide repeat protein [Paenibacillus sp. MMS20-IR301]WNS46177.1 tetratricopeptide repeat protein [Paenibacillus sp. MMS20-IR301]